MITTKLSAKGHVLIPKGVRERHGWRAGLVLEVVEDGDGVMLRPVKAQPVTTVDDLLGCLPHRGSPKKLADMEDGVAKGARKIRRA
ncbi:MAG: AbrB/MazE/SpoVT family DNA-binding domain-containing protein [Polyangiaceae bacterium]